MSRLLILGLDALDPVLVEKWRMDWFKQKVCGRHYVGFFKTLYTPIIWGAMLLGRNVENLGYNIGYIEEERAKKLYGWLYPLYRIRRKLIRRKLGIRKLLLRLGLLGDSVYTPNMPDKMRALSFIEELRREGYRVYAIEVPGYNEERNEYFRTQLARIIGRPFSERIKVAEEALEETRIRCERAIKFVEEGYDLVFVYSPLPDIAFHAVIKPTMSRVVWLRKLHHQLYNTIKPLIEIAESNGYVILMVSDHGFDLKKNYHSDYGFWSLNIDPPSFWRIKSILDFRPAIVRLVRE